MTLSTEDRFHQPTRADRNQVHRARADVKAQSKTANDSLTKVTFSILLVACAMAVASLLISVQARSATTIKPVDASWPSTDVSAAGLNLQKLTVHSERNSPPSLDRPSYLPIELAGYVAGLEPVIEVTINGRTRAYPMRVVARHQIINDRLGGKNIAVSYCKICSSAMVFSRDIGGETTQLKFSGLTYFNNMVLYDEASKSWWQQINGEALAGPGRGASLEVVPSEIISFTRFRQRHANNAAADVIALTDLARQPVMAKLNLPTPDVEDLPEGVTPADRVVVIGSEAWTLGLLRQEGRIEEKDLVILWEGGRQAAPDAFGRDEE
ncbi:MAG: DUF3179 domain-containing (seleno)protein, partial [Pseudomonadota bacterium]